MYLFLLTITPCLILSAIFTDKKYSFKSYLISIIIGFFTATLACLIKGFFIYISEIWTTDFLNNFLKIYLPEIFIPILILYGFFLLFSRDSSDFKAKNLIYLMGSYYSIVVPYMVISGKFSRTIYMVFAKPLVYFSMIVISSIILEKAFDLIKKNKILSVLLIIISLLQTAIPALIEALWHTQQKSFLYTAITVFYILIFCILSLIKKFSKDR